MSCHHGGVLHRAALPHHVDDRVEFVGRPPARHVHQVDALLDRLSDRVVERADAPGDLEADLSLRDASTQRKMPLLSFVDRFGQRTMHRATSRPI